VISGEERDRVIGASKPQTPFVEFMESLHLDELDLKRPSDRGRDVELQLARA
jgi:antitoxin Phd